MIHKFFDRLKTNNTLFIVLLVFAMMIWGGSWISGKIITSVMHPLAVAFFRFFLTFLAFIPTLIIFRQKPVIDLKNLALVTLGAAIMTGYNLLFFAGLHTGMPGAGGVLVTSINPVLTFLLVALLFKKPVRPRDFVGMALGVVGGLVLLEIWRVRPAHLLASGNLLFVIASVLWAGLTIVSGEAQKRLSLFVYSFYLYGIGSVMSFFIALPFGIEKAFRPDPVFWLNIVYLSIITSFCATSIYFFASRKISAGRASSFNLVVPLAAVIGSLIILNEIPKPVTVIGGVCAMAAIWLINGKSGAAALPAAAVLPAATPSAPETAERFVEKIKTTNSADN